jgi:hypothetical protein
MILSENQIREFIQNPRNGPLIKYLIKLKEKHELHIVGHGLDEFIETVDKVEDKGYIKVKKKLANKITVKSFEKVLRPKDKILTAKGGTTIFEFSGESESKEKIIKEVLQNINYNGHSLKSYTDQVWLDYGIWVDPMGITLIEHELTNLPEGDLVLTDGFKISYISVYDRNEHNKPIRNFHDFDFTSFNRLEYLILFLGKDDDDNKIYRVVDDEKDEFWIWIKNKEKDDIRLIEGSTIFHEFGRTPAIFNSNRLDKNNMKSFTSYCAESMIIADDLLNDYIDSRIFKKKLGIPRFWEIKSKCAHCQDGYNLITDVNNKLYKEGQTTVQCNVCGGKGYNSKERNLTDNFILDVLPQGEGLNIPPFGAVTLPTDIQELLDKQLLSMEEDLNETVWGQGTSVDKERKNTTAFEISVRNESKIDKLRAIEINKVLWLTSIINLFGTAIFKDQYKGVIKTPANQFLMLTPTEARQVYLKSKEAKSPNYQLDKLYDDYLMAEYESNPIELKRQRKIVILTPLPHLDIIEANEFLNNEEKLIKKNLEKYIYRYEHEDNGSILTDEISDIDKKFKEYANEEINTQTNDTSIQQKNTDGENV